MLDWIFEGIVTWISSIVSEIMDAVSGLFLDALGTDMTAMEEYFPFVTKAFTIMQYTAWAILFLITVWQLFRVFGGPVTETENPWTLLARSSLSALFIGYAKPIFQIVLNIATAPYTALMEVKMKKEDFTFVGVENALKNGLTTIISIAAVVGLLLLVILMIALGWNYFKLLLETVERYIVVGVLCYTSPLAFSMGASKTTVPVFKSWCRMVGSQLLLLVMNVWFLRGFSTSVGQYVGNGGELSNGNGSIFLWLFCAIAFLKTSQKFDSYLAAMGLNVAQTGSSMGLELMMAARAVSGLGNGAKSAGSVFGGGSSVAATGAFAIAGYFVYRYYQNDKKQEDRFDQLEEVEEERDENPVSPSFPTEPANPDWIGWLKIQGTSISYPVMQREGDSEYYLHRDFDGNDSFYGTPFLDSRCTMDSDNCIIYGHNINGRRMFGALHVYSSESYYREHPEIRFRTGEEKRKYQIVPVIQTTTSSPIYSFTDVGNWDEYGEYVNKILSGSMYQTKMGKQIREELEKDTPEEFFRKYQFLTLSTCRSWAGRDKRLLVVSSRKN